MLQGWWYWLRSSGVGLAIRLLAFSSAFLMHILRCGVKAQHLEGGDIAVKPKWEGFVAPGAFMPIQTKGAGFCALTKGRWLGRQRSCGMPKARGSSPETKGGGNCPAFQGWGVLIRGGAVQRSW